MILETIMGIPLSPDHFKTAKIVGDVAANGTIVASWVGLLTPISTVIAFIYICIRVYETKTFQQVSKFTMGKIKYVLDIVEQSLKK